MNLSEITAIYERDGLLTKLRMAFDLVLKENPTLVCSDSIYNVHKITGMYLKSLIEIIVKSIT